MNSFHPDSQFWLEVDWEVYQVLVREVYREMDRVENQGWVAHLGLEGLMDPEDRVVQKVRVDRDLEAHLDSEVQQSREVRVEHWDWVDRVVHLGLVVQRVRGLVVHLGQMDLKGWVSEQNH